MARPDVLLLVLAGGAGGRLEALTENRAKPAVPYAGHYRLIDVPLSNARHSGLSDVWVLQQFHPVSIEDHLANGRPWDLDRNSGGLLLLPPSKGHDREGWHEGTADAIWRHADLIRGHGAATTVVVSADAVYRLDYLEVASRLSDGDDAVLVTTEVDADDAGRYGVVQVEEGRVTEYAYKPDEPRGSLVANEVFAFRTGALLAALEESGGEGDLGDHVIPALVSRGTVREHRLEGYWRDVGTVEAYWQAHQDLVRPDPPFWPEVEGWGLLTSGGVRSPARVSAAGSVSDSLLSPGSKVDGAVRRSVLSPGVVVEEGAEVVDSVLLHDVVVRRGARVRRVVADAGVELRGEVGSSDAVTLVGR